MSRSALLLLALLAAAPLSALDTGDVEVILPFVTNAPGAFGVTTRTDLFVSNDSAAAHPITLTLYPYFGAPPVSRSASMAPRGELVVRDVVTTMFGLTNTTGQLVIVSDIATPIEARARLFRTTVSESAQQEIQGIGRGRLRKQAFLYGISGDGGHTVTYGAANPNAGSIQIKTVIASSGGTVLYRRLDTVGAHQNVQFPNIFTGFGIPPQDVQIKITSVGGEPIYGWALELDGVSIDFAFVFGTSP